MRLKALLLFLLVSFTAFAQTDHDLLTYSVSGNVTDAEDGYSLQYVTVSIPGTQYATVSNSEGGFTIKCAQKPEYIEFSLLGYKTARIVAPDEPEANLKIRLQKKYLTLNEARVIYGDPLEILNAAISKIETNYPAQPELFECFYRETVQKRSRYIYISEAVAKMYKTSYSRDVTQDRVSITRSRTLNSPRPQDTLSVTVIGGPSQGVTLDLVKEHEFLSPENISHYKFGMASPAMIDDRLQYAITLEPATETEYALYHGVIYIDRETLAFTRFDITLDMSDKTKATRMMLIKKPAGLRFTPLELSLQYNYSMEGGVSRMRYIRTKIRFKCDWKRRLFRTDYTAVSEMVTTDRQTGEVQQIPRGESFRNSDALSLKASADYDASFWKDYNIIEPTESLDRAIGKIKKR